MPVELIVQGIDQASEVLDRVSEKTDHMGAAIGLAAGVAVAALAGFVALGASFMSVVSAASEAQDSMSRFDAVYAATSRAAADAADSVLTSAGKTVTTGKLSAAAVSTLTDSVAAMSLEVPVATAKLAENSKILEINIAQHRWSAEAIAVHKAELAKEAGALQALSDRLADAKDKLAGAAGTTKILGAMGAAAAASTMMERDAMIKLSESLAGVTVFSHEAVLGAEGVLLTFRDIGKDVMPQATQATLNLATRLGTDAESAARMLGKALVDPGVGLLRLKAAGIDFTKAQDAVIKKMAESGDVAGAQKVILDALEKSIGGTALAAGQTLSGELKRAEHAMDDVKEKIGTALLPMLQAGTEGFIKFLGSDAVQKGAQEIAIALGLLADGNVWSGIIHIGEAFGMTEAQMKPLADTFTLIQDGFFKLIAAFQGGGLAGVGEMLAQGFQSLLPALEALGARLGPIIQGWADRLGPPVMAMINQLVGFIVSNVPVWIAAWYRFEFEVIAWVERAVPPLLTQLGVFANQMFGWVAAQVGPWATALGALVGPAVAWILAALPGLATNLGTFAGQLLSFLLQLVADAAGAFLPLAWQFISWIVTDVLPQLPDALGQILTAMVNFLTSLGDAVGPKLGELGKRFVDWVTASGGPADQIGAKLAEFGTAIQTWLTTTGATLGTKFQELGSNLMTAIGKGILDAVNAAIAAINAAIQALEAALKAAAGIHSPSTVYAGFGRQLMLGLAQGITDGAPAALQSMSAAMSALQVAPAGLSGAATGSAAGGASGLTPLATPTPVQIVAHVYNNMDIEDLAYKVFQVRNRNGS